MSDNSSEWPLFADLPDGWAMGVFGSDDVLGCLNKADASAVITAAQLVRDGAVFSLSARMNWPSPTLYRRKAPEHHIITTEAGNHDEWLDSFYPQASSQWDGFLHVCDGERGFYNEMEPEQLGVESWGRRGIVGRGVLLDIQRWRRNVGHQIRWTDREEVAADELQECAASQGVEIQEGDILLVRFGWTSGYEAADETVRSGLGTHPPSPGLKAAQSTAALLWDWGISAIAADNPALEAWPPGDDFLHTRLLPRLGLPIGELWWLDELDGACAADQRYDMLLSAAPLVLPGGVGSSANALAIR